jgi:hypothetical protein
MLMRLLLRRTMHFFLQARPKRKNLMYSSMAERFVMLSCRGYVLYIYFFQYVLIDMFFLFRRVRSITGLSTSITVPDSRNKSPQLD